jgi:hypothetical protein
MFGKSLPNSTRSWNSSTRLIGGGPPRYLLNTMAVSRYTPSYNPHRSKKASNSSAPAWATITRRSG